MLAFSLRHKGHALSFDRTRTDRVGPDIEGAKFDSQGFGETDDSPFRRDVGRAIRKTENTGSRGCHDDGAGTLRLHQRRGIFCKKKSAFQTNGDARPPVSKGNVFDGITGSCNTGIGAKRVDRTPFGNEFLK